MRVAVYARVSTEKQEEEQTVQSQLRLLSDYVKEHDYLMVNEYVDNGWSGETLARPSLDKLRDDASKKLFDAILITCPDRLARKHLYQGLITEELKKQNIKVLFINMGENEETPENNLLIGMQGLIAEYEKTKILERTRRGKLHKAKSGNIVGSIPPFGYRYVKKTNETKGYYEINKEEAKIVELIFSLVVNQSFSLRGVVKELLKRKVKTREGNDIWSRSTLSRIISNESYTGTTYYNKHYSTETNSPNTYKRRLNTGRRRRPREEWIPITIPSIISKEVFKKAQKKIKENTAFSKRNTKNNYLLKGLIYCGNCGEKYYGTPCHGTTYYRCSNRLKRFPFPKNCSNKSYISSNLDKVVWENVLKIMNNPQVIEDNINKLFNKESSKKEFEKITTEINKKILKFKAEEEKWLVAYREDVIDVDLLKEKLTTIKSEIIDLNNELDILKKKSSISIDNVKNEIENTKNAVKEMLTNLNLSEEVMQKIIRLLIDRVEINNKVITLNYNLSLSSSSLSFQTKDYIGSSREPSNRYRNSSQLQKV